ncbi:hypothetical protein [Nitratireductor soli]|uniref:hypothetical protein n=1 Tax=Nitratireductor soli TaxID=1670619 RepID=UPI000AB2DF5D|nr:hypothetical protein [Nitratireductor soli]
MKVTMQVTLDAMTRTLRRLAHQAAVQAEQQRRARRRKPRDDDRMQPPREGRDDEPGRA